MLTTSSFSEIASLMGDPARANMLGALMDGRALTASELAACACIMPQTASGHLARLTQAGLLTMERQGRHRYHRLASPAVARMIEGVMAVAATSGGTAQHRQPRVSTGPRETALRAVRTCYDHLAGRLAVTMADRMVERGEVDLSPDGGALTDSGFAFLRGLGVSLDGSRGRVFCRPCLDWSERRPHIAGLVGAALCRHCLDQGWLRRMDGSRALTVTRAGEAALFSAFAVRMSPLAA